MEEFVLKSVNPNQMKWCVIVRIIRLWESRNTRTGETISLDMILLDREESQMHAVIWKRQAERFRDNLREGTVYKITNFKVIESKEKYKPVDEQYIINFLPNTSLVELPDDSSISIAHHKFCF
ncbi:hypothetical protein HS088_TW07G01084 [Tripterygium wilfordii]|uniref:Replication protein A 70 kDa DNA-binding subunit B/D first OB fold domain-containing protein n=1 Tax=Tripterygium wilfordii TaxID=458696 RepID=A0A7J7DGL5_TRIWF|nr:hypothetical protein HS088_TW07G01084 [Tripterygium wilfordii]